MAARRAATRLAADAADGFNRLGSIKLWVTVPQVVDAETGYLQDFARQVWEWKSDHPRDIPSPNAWRPARTEGAESNPYIARIQFERPPGDSSPYDICFASTDDASAVADARRWVANRQHAVPTWFGSLVSLEVLHLNPGFVDEDGTVPSHVGRQIYAETVDSVPSP